MPHCRSAASSSRPQRRGGQGGRADRRRRPGRGPQLVVGYQGLSGATVRGNAYRFQQMAAELVEKDAGRSAWDAEHDAVAAITLASYCLDAAEWAVLCAGLIRAHAGGRSRGADNTIVARRVSVDRARDGFQLVGDKGLSSVLAPVVGYGWSKPWRECGPTAGRCMRWPRNTCSPMQLRYRDCDCVPRGADPTGAC